MESDTIKHTKKGKQCSRCVYVEITSPIDEAGQVLPYGSGLVGCVPQGVGYYPNQINYCQSFKEK